MRNLVEQVSAILSRVPDGRPLTGERYHLVGLAGRGMAPLAVAARHLGAQVSGCDHGGLRHYLDFLHAAGIDPATTHSIRHFAGGATVVASSVVPAELPELVAAAAAGRLWHRTDLLARVLATRRSLGVSGSHGKGTVAALAAAALEGAGLDPLAILGVMVPRYAGATRLGAGPIVAEVDDSDLTVSRVCVDVAVVTNLDHDHPYLDHRLADAVQAVGEFVGKARERVLVGPSPRAERLAAHAKVEVWRVGRELTARTMAVGSGETRLELRAPDGVREEATIRLIGPRSGPNAALAFGAALSFGAEPAAAAAGLGTLDRLYQRLEPIVERDGVRIFADYGFKHPVNMRTGLEALRRHFPRARIVAVFEPYVGYLAPWGRRYARALGLAERVVLAPPTGTEDFPDGRPFDPAWYDACPVPVVHADKAEALDAGLAECRPGDVLVLFGRTRTLAEMTEQALAVPV
ncbi:MAG: UDP-N-acetylmuramate--alanine ligase [Nocardioidaceae bacterium]|nr:UDP-N-acetylmuramate--alanine ligase [Nocardioidaceae bacterium]